MNQVPEHCILDEGGFHGHDLMVVLQLPVQSLPINTKLQVWITLMARCTQCNIMW